MTDAISALYIAVAVFVSLLSGAGVVGVLVWRRFDRHFTRVAERMEAWRSLVDRGARLTGHRIKP